MVRTVKAAWWFSPNKATRGEKVFWLDTSVGGISIKSIACPSATSFILNSDISADGGVYKLLSKLLVLEGKSILFWELSKPVRLCI